MSSSGRTAANTPVTVPNGGTGKTALTAHGVLIGEGASAVAITSAGTAGQVLTSNGASSDPTFQAGGGTTAGAIIVRKFPIAFNSSNILTGHTIYTPTVGDILHDAWIQIDTAWDGTTPTGDIGMFNPSNDGWFHWSLCAIDMTVADTAVNASTAGLLMSTFNLSNLIGSQAVTYGSAFLTTPAGTPTGPQPLNFVQPLVSSDGERLVPSKFAVANPIKVVVSQNGTNNGANPGSTVGSGVVYLVTSTPT